MRCEPQIHQRNLIMTNIHWDPGRPGRMTAALSDFSVLFLVFL